MAWNSAGGVYWRGKNLDLRQIGTRVSLRLGFHFSEAALKVCNDFDLDSGCINAVRNDDVIGDVY